MDIYKYNMYYQKVLSTDSAGRNKSPASGIKSVPLNICSGKNESSRYRTGNGNFSGGRRQSGGSIIGSPSSQHSDSTSTSSVSGKSRSGSLMDMFKFLTARSTTDLHRAKPANHNPRDFVTANPIHEGIVLK
ncbi:hypothetical protein ACHWQZ_G000625 [Mnemiopsis leidyi]